MQKPRPATQCRWPRSNSLPENLPARGHGLRRFRGVSRPCGDYDRDSRQSHDRCHGLSELSCRQLQRRHLNWHHRGWGHPRAQQSAQRCRGRGHPVWRLVGRPLRCLRPRGQLLHRRRRLKRHRRPNPTTHLAMRTSSRQSNPASPRSLRSPRSLSRQTSLRPNPMHWTQPKNRSKSRQLLMRSMMNSKLPHCSNQPNRRKRPPEPMQSRRRHPKRPQVQQPVRCSGSPSVKTRRSAAGEDPIQQSASRQNCQESSAGHSWHSSRAPNWLTGTSRNSSVCGQKLTLYSVSQKSRRVSRPPTVCAWLGFAATGALLGQKWAH